MAQIGRHITRKNGFANNNVAGIAIDAQGNKWFATNGGGVSKFDGTNWTTFNTLERACQ